MSWLNDLYNTLFNPDKNLESNNTRKSRSSPAKIDLTFPETVDACFTRGLWNNTISGYKLGAQLCRPPIAVPLAFMGFPHFDLEDWDVTGNQEFWRERFNFYNTKYMMLKLLIQLMCHRDGTFGIFPWFDANKGFVRWKFIKPEYIPDGGVITDPETEDIIAIITEIQYYFIGLSGRQYIYTEKKQYTENRIITSRMGDIPPGMRTEMIRNNPIKKLPIFFTNNKEPGEFEGHSDLQPIVPHVKAYSSINKVAHEELANNGTKLVQYGSDDAKTWAKNNGFAGPDGDLDPDLISIENIDFIYNLYEKEKSEFITPAGIVDSHINLLELDFKNIYQGSGLPEMLWGGKITGNHATAQEQMSVLLSFVRGKQNQADPPYDDLINNTMLLEAIANNQMKPEGIMNIWNDLDSLTEVERSQIFDNYAAGVQKLLDSYSIDLQTAHKLLRELTKGVVTSDYDDFKKQIEEYGSMKSFLEQEYINMRLESEINQNKTKSEKEQRNGKKSKDSDKLKLNK